MLERWSLLNEDINNDLCKLIIVVSISFPGQSIKIPLVEIITTYTYVENNNNNNK